jgi:hypothetical protein
MKKRICDFCKSEKADMILDGILSIKLNEVDTDNNPTTELNIELNLCDDCTKNALKYITDNAPNLDPRTLTEKDIEL